MDVVHCVLQFGAVVDVEVIDDFLWYAWSWSTTMKLSCEHALLFIRSPKAVFTHVLARHLTGGILGRKLVRACSRNDKFCAAYTAAVITRIVMQVAVIPWCVLCVVRGNTCGDKMSLHQQLGTNEPYSFALLRCFFEVWQKGLPLLLPFLWDLLGDPKSFPSQSRSSHPHLLALLVTFELWHNWPRLPWRGFAHAVGSCQIDHLCHAQFTGEKLCQHCVAVFVLGLVDPVEHKVVPHAPPLQLNYRVVVVPALSRRFPCVSSLACLDLFRYISASLA